MPVVTVQKAQLFALLGKEYTDEEFGAICFEFGIEIDNPEECEVEYKIEVGANRYDLLCIEGLARALKCFLFPEAVPPTYQAIDFGVGQQVITIEPSIIPYRPALVCAVLRGVTFTPESFKSFIDLQEKLHHNICRRRTLASVGTHDLDTIVGPFRYEGLPPTDFKFVPLRQNEEVDGLGMVKLLEEDKQLKEFLPLITGFPVFPVIRDANGVVLSIPPIINGKHSMITTNTKNVFIEVTGLDETRASIVLDVMCTMFSEYCATPFTVEKVEVRGPSQTVLTPSWETRTVEVTLDYLTKGIGLPIDKDRVVSYLRRMQLPAELSPSGTSVIVSVPPLRSDILHPCDVLEDVAIGYGFNTILENAVAPPTVCRGVQRPLEQICSTLSKELAHAGWTEVLTFGLCSEADNYDSLRRKKDGKAVIVGNPLGEQTSTLRTNLFSGLLKTVFHNMKVPLPMNIFELSDVVKLDTGVDVGARNERNLCAFHVSTGSSFEVIHGLLDTVLHLNRILHFLEYEEWEARYKKKAEGIFYTKYYRLIADKDDVYFPGSCGRVELYDTVANSVTVLGHCGVIHPEVLDNYGIPVPISAFHINVELLL